MQDSRWPRFAAALIALFTILAVFLSAGATEPAPGPFANTWARTDLPIQSGQVDRTWIWAPEAFTEVLQEPYAESPGGMRDVQYFDKSRMEITDPSGDPDSPWYVTNGLLVLEMVEGYSQTGNAASEPREPSTLPIAGDHDGTNAPSYADIADLMDLAPAEEGATIIRRLNPDGTFTDDPSLAVHSVAEGPNAAEYGREHRTASVFWEFMTSTGTIWDGEQYTDALLFLNPYYATGLPIAPSFWATVNIAGTPKDVLIQCFERRCLTFTPDNAPGWRVEAGNVGLHYFTWRYPVVEDPGQPDATATSASTSAPTAEPTQSGDGTPAAPTSTTQPTLAATLTAIPSATVSVTAPAPAPTSTITAIPTMGATSTSIVPPTSTSMPSATATTPYDDGPTAACLNSAESAFLTLINQYRAQNELGPLVATRSLNVASYNHSLDMSVNNYFSHTSQNGDSPWDRMSAAGYDYNTYKGENIAAGYQTAQAVFDGWRNSPGHNANMLDPNFNAIGIGYVSDGNYWTTDFGGIVDALPEC